MADDFEPLRKRLLQAVLAGPQAPGPHVADDLDTLTAFELGVLPDGATRDLLCHIATCCHCCHELVEMVGTERIEAEMIRLAPPPRKVFLSNWLAVGALGVAAALLLGLLATWPLWPPLEPTPAELVLRTWSWRLTDFGFLDNGLPPKGVPGKSMAEEREALQQAVASRPEDPLLRVRYGYLLLTGYDAREAEVQFRRALESPSFATVAHLGLGISRYMEEDYAQALSEFEAVMEADPQHPAARFNADLCRLRLQQAIPRQK